MILKSLLLFRRAVSVATLALLFVASAVAGTITGALTTNGGSRIAAILTLHDLSTPRTVGSTPFDRQFSSRSDGTFSIPNVPPGQYEICVDAPKAAALDPCEWTPGGAPRITVKGAAASSLLPVRVQIKVETGYMLQVHLNDPQQTLTSTLGGAGGNSVLLRLVGMDSRLHNFRLLSASATGQDRFIVMPYNSPVMLTVDTPTAKDGAPALAVTGSTILALPGAGGSAAKSPGGDGAAGLKPVQGGAAPITPPGLLNVPGITPFQTIKGAAKVPIMARPGQSAAPIVLNIARP